MIVAVDAAFGIAKNNDLPWHLPKEYAHFVKQTTETSNENALNAVVMGRKCWDSIPARYRPLKNRVNVIISRTMEPVTTENFVVSPDFNEALNLLNESELFRNRVETIWNIGGSEIYKLGLDHPSMNKLVLTRINEKFDCDVRFPDVDWSVFQLNDDFTDEKVSEKGLEWYVTSYTKINA